MADVLLRSDRSSENYIDLHRRHRLPAALIFVSPDFSGADSHPENFHQYYSHATIIKLPTDPVKARTMILDSVRQSVNNQDGINTVLFSTHGGPNKMWLASLAKDPLKADELLGDIAKIGSETGKPMPKTYILEACDILANAKDEDLNTMAALPGQLNASLVASSTISYGVSIYGKPNAPTATVGDYYEINQQGMFRPFYDFRDTAYMEKGRIASAQEGFDFGLAGARAERDINCAAAPDSETCSKLRTDYQNYSDYMQAKRWFTDHPTETGAEADAHAQTLFAAMPQIPAKYLADTYLGFLDHAAAGSLFQRMTIDAALSFSKRSDFSYSVPNADTEYSQSAVNAFAFRSKVAQASQNAPLAENLTEELLHRPAPPTDADFMAWTALKDVKTNTPATAQKLDLWMADKLRKLEDKTVKLEERKQLLNNMLAQQYLPWVDLPQDTARSLLAVMTRTGGKISDDPIYGARLLLIATLMPAKQSLDILSKGGPERDAAQNRIDLAMLGVAHDVNLSADPKAVAFKGQLLASIENGVPRDEAVKEFKAMFEDPHLDKAHRIHALHELVGDQHHAGVSEPYLHIAKDALHKLTAAKAPTAKKVLTPAMAPP